MSSFKLIYFEAKGRAEIARLIFAQAGVEYEDCRLPYGGEEWKKLKPTTPTGMLPVLEVDGKPLAGSGPINQYLAHRFGLAGSNDFENAQVASIVDVVNDIFGKVAPCLFEPDTEKRQALKKQVIDEHIPKYWGVIEKIIAKNGSDSGWTFRNEPTYADFTLYTCIDYSLILFPDILQSYPAIAKLKASVESLPNIAKWLEKRPKTQY